MSLLLAVVVATLLAVPGTPYPVYRSWWTWNPLGAGIGLVIYFLAAGLGGGFLGWVLGLLTGALTEQPPWLRGIVFGITGAAALRAGLRVKPAPTTLPTGKDPAGDTVSALSMVLAWTAHSLDHAATEGAQRWFAGLSQGDLLYHSHQISGLIRSRRISDAGKKKILTRFVEVVEQLRSPDPHTSAEGHAHLVTMCAEYVVAEHIPRTRFTHAPQPSTPDTVP